MGLINFQLREAINTGIATTIRPTEAVAARSDVLNFYICDFFYLT